MLTMPAALGDPSPLRRATNGLLEPPTTVSEPSAPAAMSLIVVNSAWDDGTSTQVVPALPYALSSTPSLLNRATSAPAISDGPLPATSTRPSVSKATAVACVIATARAG